MNAIRAYCFDELMDEKSVMRWLHERITTVAGFYGVSVPVLLASPARPDLVTARILAFDLCRNVAGVDMARLAKAFGVADPKTPVLRRSALLVALAQQPAEAELAEDIYARLGWPLPGTPQAVQWPEEKASAAWRMAADLAPFSLNGEQLADRWFNHAYMPWHTLVVDVLRRFPVISRQQLEGRVGYSHKTMADRTSRLPYWLANMGELRATDRWLSFLFKVPFRKESRVA